MRKFLTTGLFSAILGIVIGGAPADAALVSRGFLDEALENYATTTALDLKANQSDFTDLSNKIGELPSGSLIGNGPATDPLFEFTQGTDTPVLPNSLSDLIKQLYGSNEKPGVISALLHGFSLEAFSDKYDVGVLPAMELSLSATQAAETAQETATAAKTAADANTAKIGTLPSGNFPGFPESKNLFSKLRQPLTYPTSLAELITAIYGNSETGGPGLLAAIITGFPTDPDGDGSPDKIVGLITNFWLARDANNLANANATKIGTVPDGKNLAGMISETDAKIGTLPSGNFPDFPESEKSFSILKQPHTYPTSLAELITALYGISGTGAPGLLGHIIASFPLDTDGDGSPDEFVGIIPNFYRATDANDLANANATKIGTVPDGKNLAGMISETDAKIGDLPTEYETVGAALTAIKGIAEDAKAAALSAIPDPKAEGSTGKFVLTVDIVGDNATYRWEKIDR